MQSNDARLLVALGLCLSAGTCGVLSSLVLYAMIGQINLKLPEELRIGYFFFHWGKYQRILREYRRLYPRGRLDFYFKGLIAGGAALMLGCAWRLGFFR